MNQLTPLTIGRFRIEQGIGQGGMGIVYRAYDTVLQRPVALKLLGAHLNNDEQARSRFRREAATLMRLKHSNIALVYDFGEHEGRPYIAMEWVEGRTLKNILQEEGRLPLARSLHIITQLARALDYAHAHGVVHRDVKPANILIDENNHATLVDFGVAWWDEAPSLTTTGSIVGTPLYMAPEQLLGQPVDGRADLYSLAAIFYEMLAGHPPFGGDDASAAAVIQQQIYLPPPPLDEQNPAIPRQAAAAVEKALSKLPDDRFARGEDFVRALHRRAEPTPAPGRRKRVIFSLAMAGLALILLVGLGLRRLTALGDVAPTAPPAPVFSPTPRPAPTATPAAEAPLIPVDQPDGGEWPGIHGDARQFRYQESGFWPLAAAPRWHYRAGTALTQPLVAADGQIYLTQAEQVQILDWATGTPAENAPSLGADIAAPLTLGYNESLQLYAATADNQLYAFDGYDLRLLWRLGADALDEEKIIHQAVGEDGVLVVATDSGRIMSVDATGDVRFTLTLDDNAELTQPPSITPAGIYGVTDSATLIAIDANTGAIVWQAPLNAPPTTPALPMEAYGVAAVGDESGMVQAQAILSGETRWQRQLDGSVTGLAYNEDELVVSTDAGQLYALSPENGEIRWRRTVSGSLLAPIITLDQVLALSQDGVLNVYASEDGAPWPPGPIHLGVHPAWPPMLLGGWLVVQDQTSVWAFGPQERGP